MVEAIQLSAGKPMDVTVLREKQTLAFRVTPTQGNNERGQQVWIIGIQPGQEWSFRKANLSQAAVSAFRFTVDNTGQILGVVGRLFTGAMSVKQLQSVIGIANEAGHAVQEGTFAVIILMAGMSLNL